MIRASHVRSTHFKVRPDVSAWRLPRRLACAMGLAAWSAAVHTSGICHASGHAAPSHEPAEAAAAEVPLVDENSDGVFLGDFDVRSHYPVKAQKIDVKFVLYAAVSEENRERARHVAHERRHKIRDQVIMITRLAPLAEFDEPDLKRVRRRVLLRLRRTLPELVIDDVLISEFQINVQSL